MKVVNLYQGGFWSNVYCLGEENGPCIVIDLGENAKNRIIAYTKRHHSKCLGILLTHGHVDHIYGLSQLNWEEKIPCFLHGEDFECLGNPKKNASDLVLSEQWTYEIEGLTSIEDGESLFEGEYMCQVIHTPFHTRGSCCFYFPKEGILFSGDTLFHLGIGRSDLPGSCPGKQDHSLAKLLSLPESTLVYPGHGPRTSLKEEKEFNPAYRYLPF